MAYPFHFVAQMKLAAALRSITPPLWQHTRRKRSQTERSSQEGQQTTAFDVPSSRFWVDADKSKKDLQPCKPICQQESLICDSRFYRRWCGASTADNHSQQKVMSFTLSAEIQELKFILPSFQSNNRRLHKISSGWGNELKTDHTEE